jgi:hypothetical protein
MTIKPIPITSFDDIEIVLGKSGFDTVPYAVRHHALGEHLGIDVSEIVKATEAIPLCLRGEAHQTSRRRLAKLIADAAAQADAVVESSIPELLANLFRPGWHDVNSEFINPCVERIIGAHIGVSVQIPDDSLLSRVFSQSIGVAKRKRLNGEIGELRRLMARTVPALTEQEIGDRIALAILGTDALRGTLGQSLKDLIERGASATGDVAPPKTGVPYIDREVLAPTVLSGSKLEAGTVVRAELKAFNGSSSEAHKLRFFGFGPHTCLGRRLSIQLWKKIAETWRQQAADVKIIAYALRRDDVFDIPETFEIEVGPTHV